MQQLDMFKSDPTLQLYKEINETRDLAHSLRKALFSFMRDMEDQIVHLRDQLQEKKEQNNENALQ